MTIFTKAIDDIFACKDFLEQCTINQNVYDCICSSLEDSITFGDVGAIDDVNFTLSIKLSVLHKMPKQGDKVAFRCQKYKVSSVALDSANASITLHLQSLSKG